MGEKVITLIADYMCPTCGKKDNMVSMSTLMAVCEACETFYEVLWRTSDTRRIRTKAQQDVDDLEIESPRRW